MAERTEIDSRALVENVIQEGAVKVEGFFDAADTAQLSRLGSDVHVVSRRVPRFGELVFGLAKEIQVPDDDIVLDTVEMPAASPGAHVSFHKDNIGRLGISLLMPIGGSPADFYYADVPQSYPDRMLEAKQLSYGVGDVMILRQKLTLVSNGEGQDYDQVYHLGKGSDERFLFTVDLWKPTPVHMAALAISSV